MLNQAGITNTTTQLKINVILSCWCLIVSIIGSFMLDIIGRRIQTMGSIMCCIVMLYIFGGLAKSKCLIWMTPSPKLASQISYIILYRA